MDLVVFGHLAIELIKVIQLQCLSISCMKSSVKLRKLLTWYLSCCPVNPIFAQAQSIFSQTSIHYIISHKTPPPLPQLREQVYILEVPLFYSTCSLKFNTIKVIQLYFRPKLSL